MVTDLVVRIHLKPFSGGVRGSRDAISPERARSTSGTASRVAELLQPKLELRVDCVDELRMEYSWCPTWLFGVLVCVGVLPIESLVSVRCCGRKTFGNVWPRHDRLSMSRTHPTAPLHRSQRRRRAAEGFLESLDGWGQGLSVLCRRSRCVAQGHDGVAK